MRGMLGEDGGMPGRVMFRFRQSIRSSSNYDLGSYAPGSKT